MAIGYVEVTVVDVGQGQCTYAAIWNDNVDDPTLLHTLIFDCGSDKKHEGVLDNLKFIAEEISSMETPTIDCIFFSHSDTDHINLTQDLLSKFDNEKKPIVKKVIYCGNREDYTKGRNKFNILNYLEKNYMPSGTTAQSMVANATGFDKDNDDFDDTKKLWEPSTGSDLFVGNLAGNVLTTRTNFTNHKPKVPSGKRAEQKNRVSLIACLVYKTKTFVICGDATNATMGAVGRLLKNSTYFSTNNNLMTTVPHHGSRTTGLSVSNTKKAKSKAIDVVTTFAKKLDSLSVSVSAYDYHSHPSMEVLQLFAPEYISWVRDTRLEGKSNHLLVGYLNTALNKRVFSDTPDSLGKRHVTEEAIPPGYHTISTRAPVYPTWYYKGSIDFAYDFAGDAYEAKGIKKPNVSISPYANWVYIIYPSESFFLFGQEKLGVTNFTEAADNSTNYDESADNLTLFASPKRTISIESKEQIPSVPKPVALVRKTSRNTSRNNFRSLPHLTHLT